LTLATLESASKELPSLVSAIFPRTLWKPPVNTSSSIASAGNIPPQPVTLDDYRLYLGAKIAQQIREKILQETQYTCTGGIAHNKMLAKIASAQNKPNKQTVVPYYVLRGLFDSLPLGKVRQMGGKLGKLVKKTLNITMAGDLYRYPLHQLSSLFGDETGRMLWNMARGNVIEKIVPRSKIKSMASAKQFPPISDIEGIKRWMTILTSELVNRMFEELEETNRWPRTLQLHAGTPSAERSKQCPIPPQKPRDLLHTELFKLGLTLFNTLSIKFPCRYLALGVTGLFQNDVSSTRISDFFAKALSSLPPTQSQNANALVSKHAGEEKRPVDIKSLFHKQKSQLDTNDPGERARSNTLIVAPKSPSVEASPSPFLSSSPTPAPVPRTQRHDSSSADRLNSGFPDTESFGSLEPKLHTIVAGGVTPEMRKSTLHRFFTSKKEVSGKVFLSYFCCSKQPNLGSR